MNDINFSNNSFLKKFLSNTFGKIEKENEIPVVGWLHLRDKL